MAKPRRMRSHRSAGAARGATPLREALPRAWIGVRVPAGKVGARLLRNAPPSADAVAGSAGAMLAQPLNRSSPVRAVEMRNFI